jgi:hypothetical protein
MVAGLTIKDGINHNADTHYFNINGNLEWKKTKKPTNTYKKEQLYSSGEIIPWGKDNNEPQRIVEDGRKLVEIESILDLKGRLLYGNGIIVGRITGLDEQGNEIFTPVYDPKIQQFLKKAGFYKYFLKASLYFYWMPILFPEIIMSYDRKSIAYCNLLETNECRWGKPNESTGIIENCYVQADWKQRLHSDSVKIPVLNPYFPDEDLKNSKGFRYVYPLNYPSIGNKYYPKPTWNALRTSGWLDVAESIPKYKKHFFENQLTLKYHIETTREWWEWKYKGFENMAQEERIVLIKKEQQSFEAAMTGQNGVGKSIFTTGYVDDRSGNYIPGWKITELKNHFGKGEYLEDNNEAKSHVILGMGIPSALLNILGSGTGMSAGSGTDIRVAYNLYINTITAHRDLILEPWNFILQYNGFGDDIVIKTRYNQITTLENKSEQEQKV